MRSESSRRADDSRKLVEDCVDGSAIKRTAFRQTLECGVGSAFKSFHVKPDYHPKCIICARLPTMSSCSVTRRSANGRFRRAPKRRRRRAEPAQARQGAAIERSCRSHVNASNAWRGVSRERPPRPRLFGTGPFFDGAATPPLQGLCKAFARRGNLSPVIRSQLLTYQ